MPGSACHLACLIRPKLEETLYLCCDFSAKVGNPTAWLPACPPVCRPVHKPQTLQLETVNDQKAKPKPYILHHRECSTTSTAMLPLCWACLAVVDPPPVPGHPCSAYLPSSYHMSLRSHLPSYLPSSYHILPPISHLPSLIPTAGPSPLPPTPLQVLFSSTLMLSSFKNIEARRENAMRSIEESSKLKLIQELQVRGPQRVLEHLR